jgi:hypothetical protein
MPHNKEKSTAIRNKITILQFYAYRFSVRGGFNHIHSGGKLFQQYLVDSYVKAEANNLYWYKKNQKELRVENYKGLMDHIGRTKGNNCDVGKVVILPSSFSVNLPYLHI